MGVIGSFFLSLFIVVNSSAQNVIQHPVRELELGGELYQTLRAFSESKPGRPALADHCAQVVKEGDKLKAVVGMGACERRTVADAANNADRPLLAIRPERKLAEFEMQWRDFTDAGCKAQRPGCYQLWAKDFTTADANAVGWVWQHQENGGAIVHQLHLCGNLTDCAVKDVSVGTAEPVAGKGVFAGIEPAPYTLDKAVVMSTALKNHLSDWGIDTGDLPCFAKMNVRGSTNKILAFGYTQATRRYNDQTEGTTCILTRPLSSSHTTFTFHVDEQNQIRMTRPGNSESEVVGRLRAVQGRNHLEVEALCSGGNFESVCRPVPVVSEPPTRRARLQGFTFEAKQ